jgi:tetratricopeptide (TPR) repeat protein
MDENHMRFAGFGDMNEFYVRLDELRAEGDLAVVEAFILDAVAGSADDSPERAGLYNELGGFYKHIGRYAESEGEFARALGIFEAAGKCEAPEYATVLLNLADTLTARAARHCRDGDYHGALGGFRQALELTRRAFGENIDFANCKRNISDICELLGHIPLAITELSDAARILEGILGSDHPTVHEARDKLEQLSK